MGALLERRLLLYVCFFLSGTAGLVYEVLWARILGLTFGHNVYGVTTVLAAFMGGLALGSYQLGRLSDRLKDPLRFYAFLELGIGLYCLIIPVLLSVIRSAFLALYPHLTASQTSRTLVQFVLAFLVLIIPTTLMGGTLPAVTRVVVKDPHLAGRKVALLYGTNTLGAVLGALAAGYWLLPALGTRSTNQLGVAANLAAGLIVLVWLRGPSQSPAIRIGSSKPVGGITGTEVALLICFALSGAVAMSYQIAWTRALILVIGSSTYAFTCILVTFLSGIAIGSYLFNWIREGARLVVFAGIQAGIALSAFMLIPFFQRLPDIYFSLIGDTGWSHGRILLVQFAIVSSVVLVPTILMGMTLPCITGILTRDLGRLGRDVGSYYAFNTTGAIGGSVITGFFLIPLIGTQMTLSLGIGINLLLAVIVLGMARPRWTVPLAAGFAAVSVVLWSMPPWNTKVMHSGVSIYGQKYVGQDRREGFESRFEGMEIPFSREGISTTVAVVQDPLGNRALLVNGKTDASNTSLDLETMVKTAFIPMIVHTGPEDVAIIGLGSGVTAGVSGLFDSVETVDVVELEPAVIEAAKYFEEENLGILDDPAVAFHIDDGRTFVEGTGELYDVIISQPSNPWISGVSALFTQEFMIEAKGRLDPGGIFCMWIQGYSISPDDLKMILRTFAAVFPHATLWQGSIFDYILIGWKDEPVQTDMGEIQDRIHRNPDLLRAVALFEDLTPDGLIDSFRLGPAQIVEFSGPGPLNTDDRDILEFSAPRSLYRSYRFRIEEDIWEARYAVYPPFIRR